MKDRDKPDRRRTDNARTDDRRARKLSQVRRRIGEFASQGARRRQQRGS